MKKFLASFLFALSLVTISGFDTSLNTNTSSLLTKQNAMTIMSKAEAAEISEGVVAPDFAFTELTTGKVMNLSDLRDKPVYLNFWATWCPPCVRELPHIQAKYEQYKDKIHFLAISLDGEQAAPAEFIPAKGYTFPVGYGNEREISRTYNVEAIPMSLMIDTNGVVKAKIVGSMDETDLERFIQKGL